VTKLKSIVRTPTRKSLAYGLIALRRNSVTIEELYKERRVKEIKRDMAELVRDNLPVSFSRSEADSFYGIGVDLKGNITGGEGYAEGIKAERLEDLPIVDLAGLIQTIIKES
jgi:hypothetical protein